MRFLMLLAALPLVACNGVASGKGDAAPAQGAGTTRSFAVADFTGVELAGADDVDVRIGNSFSVRAEGPSDVLDRLDIRRDGSVLRVGRKRDGSWTISRGQGVKVYVTMPAIDRASLAGSGNLSVDRVSGDEFKGSLAGSGNLRVAGMQAREAEFEIAGSGNVTAAGQVDKLEIDIAGSGDVAASGLTATEAKIAIAGSGDVAAKVTRHAKVSVMGSGDVTLTGGAQCESHKMGSGDIRCS